MYFYRKYFFKKVCNKAKLFFIFALANAEVAQLVELQPSKLVVASSSLVFRSNKNPKHLFRVFCFSPFLKHYYFNLHKRTSKLIRS